ncbi:MAG: hypothetical protein J7J82_06355 [Staphylothermus sp.]|nr:hypothetical protein [Staphylothermus sp.]
MFKLRNKKEKEENIEKAKSEPGTLVDKLNDDEILLLYYNEEQRSCASCPFRAFCGR